uniref:Homeobox protein orthopedia-like n=1 Tax=Drosophila rhopaloa TaxID=1041015 RepID=A0A6P4G2N6_DRORH
MGDGLCGTGMFGGDRWSVGVNPMTAGFGQLNQSSPLSSSLNSGLNSGINMGSALGAGSYQHYGLNALGRCCATSPPSEKPLPRSHAREFSICMRLTKAKR